MSGAPSWVGVDNLDARTVWKERTFRWVTQMAARLPARTKPARRGYTQAHVDRVRRYKRDPYLWFTDIFGDNVYKLQVNRGSITADGLWPTTRQPADPSGLTSQQIDALNDWGAIIGAKLDAAAGLPHDAELAAKMGMSIQSAMGTGKDFLASVITWHFMFCFSYPKILATANTGKQLNEVFWSELAKVRGLARSLTPDGQSDLMTNFTMQAELLFANLPNKEERGKRWFCSPVTINTKATAEQQGEALAGRHEDHMLVVIDEASGIPEAVFKPLERTLTGKLNLVFMIFNPTQNTGFAIRSQTEHSGKWICKQWSGLDSENVSRASIANLAMYGKDSPDYRIGVLGLPPLADAGGMIPYPWIQAAIGREFDCGGEPIMSAADVGGGGDKSVHGSRQGGTVIGFKTSNSKDTMHVADWVSQCMDEDDSAVVFIDIIGIGRGVYDRLRQMNRKARPADSRNTSDDPDRFFNARAQGYWKLREQFEQGTISIPAPVDPRDSNDPIVRLCRELAAIKVEYVGKKIKIGDKKEIRKAIGFSPDYADTLMMTFWKPDSLFRKVSGGTAGKAVNFKGVFLR